MIQKNIAKIGQLLETQLRQEATMAHEKHQQWLAQDKKNFPTFGVPSASVYEIDYHTNQQTSLIGGLVNGQSGLVLLTKNLGRKMPQGREDNPIK